MGFFETHPLFLVPVIILTVEGWTALKTAVRAWLSTRFEKFRPD